MIKRLDKLSEDIKFCVPNLTVTYLKFPNFLCPFGKTCKYLPSIHKLSRKIFDFEMSD